MTRKPQSIAPSMVKDTDIGFASGDDDGTRRLVARLGGQGTAALNAEERRRSAAWTPTSRRLTMARSLKVFAQR